MSPQKDSWGVTCLPSPAVPFSFDTNPQLTDGRANFILGLSLSYVLLTAAAGDSAFQMTWPRCRPEGPGAGGGPVTSLMCVPWLLSEEGEAGSAPGLVMSQTPGEGKAALSPLPRRRAGSTSGESKHRTFWKRPSYALSRRLDGTLYWFPGQLTRRDLCSRVHFASVTSLETLPHAQSQPGVLGVGTPAHRRGVPVTGGGGCCCSAATRSSQTQRGPAGSTEAASSPRASVLTASLRHTQTPARHPPGGPGPARHRHCAWACQEPAWGTSPGHPSCSAEGLSHTPRPGCPCTCHHSRLCSVMRSPSVTSAWWGFTSISPLGQGPASWSQVPW